MIAFPWLKPVFKYGFAYCVMLCGVIYFTEVTRWRAGLPLMAFWLIFGYGAAEMLLRKSFRVIRSWKGALAAVCVLSVCFLGLKADPLGYGNRIPAGETVEFVCLISDLYNNLYKYERYEEERLAGPETAADDDFAMYDPYRRYDDWDDEWASRARDFLSVSREPAHVEQVLALHQRLISDKTRLQEADRGSDRLGIFGNGGLRIVYQLKNGSHIHRSYQVNPADYVAYLAPLLSSQEFRQPFPFTV